LARSTSLAFNQKHLVNRGVQRSERTLDRVAAFNRHVAMKDLLEHLRVSDQSIAARHGALQHADDRHLVRVITANP
jgi:hypothetical protein